MRWRISSPPSQETHDQFFTRIIKRLQRDRARARGESFPWDRFNDDETVMLQELLLAGHRHASVMQHAHTVWIGFTSSSGIQWELVHSEDTDSWGLHTVAGAFDGIYFSKSGYKDPRKLIKAFRNWENGRETG